MFKRIGANAIEDCPLSSAKRTSAAGRQTAAFDPKPT